MKINILVITISLCFSTATLAQNVGCPPTVEAEYFGKSWLVWAEHIKSTPDNKLGCVYKNEKGEDYLIHGESRLQTSPRIPLLKGSYEAVTPSYWKDYLGGNFYLTCRGIPAHLCALRQAMKK